MQTDSTAVTGFVGNTYLSVSGQAFSSNGNKAVLDIDVTSFNKIKFDCYPAVIIASLASQYCSILAEKADGTKVVLRTCKVIDVNGSGQVRVNEEYDLTAYVKLSISIGDMAASLGQIPNIQLIGNSGEVPLNAVKDYIDAKSEGIEGNVEEKIFVFETILKYFKNLRTTSTPVTAFIPKTYLNRNGTQFTGDGNRAIFDIDVSDFKNLKYN